MGNKKSIFQFISPAFSSLPSHNSTLIRLLPSPRSVGDALCFLQSCWAGACLSSGGSPVFVGRTLSLLAVVSSHSLSGSAFRAWNPPVSPRGILCGTRCVEFCGCWSVGAGHRPVALLLCQGRWPVPVPSSQMGVGPSHSRPSDLSGVVKAGRPSAFLG